MLPYEDINVEFVTKIVLATSIYEAVKNALHARVHIVSNIVSEI